MVQTIQNNIPTPDYRLASESFCYWLQGFFEMTDAKELTPKQVEMIKEHLNLVFTHKVKIPAPTTSIVTGTSVASPSTWIGGYIAGVPTEPLMTVC